MRKTNISLITKKHIKSDAEDKNSALTNSPVELVSWSGSLNENILAFQTTRLFPHFISKPALNKVNHEPINEPSFGRFNLGLHVGDNEKYVTHNREHLNYLITNELEDSSHNVTLPNSLAIQWLNQVHGNIVAEIEKASIQAITADASITRKKGVALAIMTADCLPILLSNSEGTEIAAIHGGWRPLAKNIIEQCIQKMHSDPLDIVAWLGPCIGPEAFEVGNEVKEAFLKQNILFKTAFVKKDNGKYLANLHEIAKIQLSALGVNCILTLDECTYLRTDKYYSYRKDKLTGRMASIICLR